ncbi:hypothetical protein [Flavobacterium columnare]|uniref:hypothetical protein n=1 Tax=Flavobacterium columnare TaxID=996 RepID=UPI003B9DFD39
MQQGLLDKNYHFSHNKLREFLDFWTLEKVQRMKLDDYTNVGSQSTFCYWLEFETEILGRIGGKPSNKFGIWKRKSKNPITSNDFHFDNDYAWYKKYGKTVEQAFETVKAIIIEIITYSQSKQFHKIDSLDLDSLVRWKIAFIYSNYSLIPIYKKEIVRDIAKSLEFENYRKANISDLHNFIISKKSNEEDFFEFSNRMYQIATSNANRNYYIIGSKYGDYEGNDVVDVSNIMYQKEVISTGFLWGIDFNNLLGKDYSIINNWIDKNVSDKTGKYQAAKRTLSYFLNIKSGDLIAVKSHGRYGDLTIIAYAEVLEDFKYDFNDPDLGHTIKVRFLEKNLWKNTKLSYSQTIHKITPFEREGHFEKIFGTYSLENNINDNYSDDEVFLDNEIINENDLEEDRINEKDSSDYIRTMSSSQIVTRTHNKIQIDYAKKLKLQFPNDIVRTEHKNIDIKRENDNEIHLYEVKPFVSVYSCIRDGIGQLMDYSFNNSKINKKTYLYIVGVSKPNDVDLKFVEYLKNILNIDFEYLSIDD